MVEATYPVTEREPRTGALRRLELIISLKTSASTSN
jgi:hypothetical protein